MEIPISLDENSPPHVKKHNTVEFYYFTSTQTLNYINYEFCRNIKQHIFHGIKLTKSVGPQGATCYVQLVVLERGIFFSGFVFSVVCLPFSQPG